VEFVGSLSILPEFEIPHYAAQNPAGVVSCRSGPCVDDPARRIRILQHEAVLPKC
jgi:hypothetical protein